MVPCVWILTTASPLASHARDAMVKALKTGAVVAGTFKIVEPIGEPGLGSALYVAQEIVTGHRSALRVFDPVVARGAGRRKRWEAACKVRATFESDHVVDLYAAGIDGDTPWMSLELLEGKTLAATLAEAEDGVLDGAEDLVDEVGTALAALHAAGHAAGRLSPERVFMAERPRYGSEVDAKLLDFWSDDVTAWLVAEAKADDAEDPWRAPEVTGKSPGDARADVWSFGMLAFRLMTGVIFEGPTEPDREALPGGFDPWFARCVANAPEERFADAGEALAAWDDLWDEDDDEEEEVGEGEGGAQDAEPPQDPPSLRTADRAVPLMLLVGVVIALGVWVRIVHRRAAHRHPTTVSLVRLVDDRTHA